MYPGPALMQCRCKLDKSNTCRSWWKSKARLHWVQGSHEQLCVAEQGLLTSLQYYQAKIAGLNTISSCDITSLDDTYYSKVYTNVSIASTPSCYDDHVSVSSSDGNNSSHEMPSSSSSHDKPTREALVLIHGYGGGAAVWAQSWTYFSEHFDLYALDLPGFARSDGCAAHLNTNNEAIEYMCEYLRRWFNRAFPAKSVIVLGHSFGGYVASHFAMRVDSTRIKLLVLVECWGINHFEWYRESKSGFFKKTFMKFVACMGPTAVVRGLGPISPFLLRHLRPEFARSWQTFCKKPKHFYNYVYNCNIRRVTHGERLFQLCARHYVTAKEPLMHILPCHLDKNMAVLLIFGGSSWIKMHDAQRMAEKMINSGFCVVTHTVPKAGHQIFFENPASFNIYTHRLIMETLHKCLLI